MMPSFAEAAEKRPPSLLSELGPPNNAPHRCVRRPARHACPRLFLSRSIPFEKYCRRAGRRHQTNAFSFSAFVGVLNHAVHNRESEAREVQGYTTTRKLGKAYPESVRPQEMGVGSNRGVVFPVPIRVMLIR